MKCYGLTATPIPCSPVQLREVGGKGRGVGNERVKLSQAREGVCGSDDFGFALAYHHPNLLLIGNKLN